MRKWLLALTLMLLPGLAFAASASADTGTLDKIVQTFAATSAGWVPKLEYYANGIFWILVAIDFSWHTINLALAGEDFNGMVGGLLKKVMAYGFFYFVLEKADTWMPAIINSFSQIGGQVTGINSLSPSSVMDQGFAAAGTIQNQINQLNFITNAPTVIILGWVMIFIILAYAVCAGQLLVTLVEAHLAGTAAIILLGFGGSRWTLDYVQKTLGYIMGAGIKLFVIYLIIGTGMPLLDSYISAYNASGGTSPFSQSLGLMMVAMVFMFLCFQVPSLAAAMLSGGPSMTLGSMMATGATTLAAGAGAVGMAGATAYGAAQSAAGLKQAVGAASNLAATQNAINPGSGSVAGNLASSAGQQLKKYLGFGGNAGQGTFGGGMADNMNAQNQALNMGTQPVTPPGSNPPPPDNGGGNGGNNPPPSGGNGGSGAAGSTGTSGNNGTSGSTGNTGNNGAGNIGPAGQSGASGSNGTSGSTGSTGANGTGAQPVNSAASNTGSSTSTSNTGPTTQNLQQTQPGNAGNNNSATGTGTAPSASNSSSAASSTTSSNGSGQTVQDLLNQMQPGANGSGMSGSTGNGTSGSTSANTGSTNAGSSTTGTSQASNTTGAGSGSGGTQSVNSAATTSNTGTNTNTGNTGSNSNTNTSNTTTQTSKPAGTVQDLLNQLQNAKPPQTVQDSASMSAPNVTINHAGH